MKRSYVSDQILSDDIPPLIVGDALIVDTVSILRRSIRDVCAEL